MRNKFKPSSKMNVIFNLTLVVCLLDLTVAVRLRENLNVLVPNNDVNLQEKIKTLLSGDEIDAEDFSDNEIESLSEMDHSKVDKLRKQNQQIANRVFDDKNRNIEENQLERDDSYTASNVSESSTLYSTTSEYFETTFNNSTVTETSTVPALNNSSETTAEAILNETYIPTTLIYQSSIVETTSEVSKSNSTETASTSVFNSTINATPEIISAAPTSFDAPTTVEITTTSTTEEPIYDDLQSDECLLGKAERHLKWVDVEGRLQVADLAADLSQTFNEYQDYEYFQSNVLSDNSSQSKYTVR